MKLNNSLGQKGEDAACAFLRRQGFDIVTRNWHCPFGELDVVARKSSLLVFAEVKYRSRNVYGGAAYGITPAKARKIRLSVEAYLQRHPHRGDCRVDAVLIEGDEEPRHLKNILE